MQPYSDIRQVLAQTKLRIHNEDYNIISLSLGDRKTLENKIEKFTTFFSVTYTRDEVSLVLKRSEWKKIKENFRGYKVEGPFRIITFDIILELSLIGYLSVVSSHLAEAGISIYVISTYLKDHILVKKESVETAVDVLQTIINKCACRSPE